MKRKKIFKIIVCTLISTIISGSLPLQNNFKVFASEQNTLSENETLSIEELTTEKTDVVILDNNLQHTEYTYKKDGKSYKAIETLNDSFTKGETKIYEKSIDGNYNLICTSQLNVTEDSINLKTTNKDGSIENEQFEIKDLIQNFNINNNNLRSFNTKSGQLTTSWKFYDVYCSLTKIKRYTTAFVTSALTSVLSYYFGASAAKVASISGLGTIVGVIVGDEIPLVYYNQNIYYKYALNTNPPLPRAEKTDTWFFSDYKRNIPIGKKVSYEYYVPGWK